MLTELGFPQLKPTRIFEDNASTIKIVNAIEFLRKELVTSTLGSLLSKVGKNKASSFCITSLALLILQMILLSPYNCFSHSRHVMRLDSWVTMAKSLSFFVSNPSCCALRIMGGCYRSVLPSYLSYIQMLYRTYVRCIIHTYDL